MEDVIKYEGEQLALIKQTIAKGASDYELKLFVEFCRSTKLNPFKREIWFIKTANGVQIMTGIAGFLSIANAHPQYDGMEVSIDEQNGKLISATAKVYRKDRRFPSVATVFLSEYFRPSRNGNGLWEKMPRMMLQKVAKSVALREAFSQELNGIYTEEEMPSEYSHNAASVSVVEDKQTNYSYNLAWLDKDKQAKAIDWCEKKNIEIVYDGEDILVNTSIELPFLKEVKLVNEE